MIGLLKRHMRRRGSVHGICLLRTTPHMHTWAHMAIPHMCIDYMVMLCTIYVTMQYMGCIGHMTQK